jgi:hypothetical protein
VTRGEQGFDGSPRFEHDGINDGDDASLGRGKLDLGIGGSEAAHYLAVRKRQIDD